MRSSEIVELALREIHPAALPLQALQRQVVEQRAAEEARVQQMALENAALRQELAVYRSILGNALGPNT